MGDTASQGGVSHYSTMSKSRSLASIGEAIAGGGGGYDWCKLDEYASFLHEQDAMRQKQGVVALQRKLRSDLDSQVAERRSKRMHEEEEEKRHHMNLMVELERWKETEQNRAGDLQDKVMREKTDRDEQMAFETKLKTEASDTKRRDEKDLVEKIVNEMESEQVKYETKKTNFRKNMRKIFDDNTEDQRQREIGRKKQQERDAGAMRDYNRLLDEQDESRAEELAARMERQKMLMEKMQENVAAQAKESGDNDASGPTLSRRRWTGMHTRPKRPSRPGSSRCALRISLTSSARWTRRMVAAVRRRSFRKSKQRCCKGILLSTTSSSGRRPCTGDTGILSTDRNWSGKSFTALSSLCLP